MMILESILLVICFGISFINDDFAVKLLNMVNKLPDYYWYFESKN